ncbi:MAG: BrnT family toxin [Gammaproteobacteria bacterium]|nr:BrnT family toxin [Gammaproteobacteria bacterium]
MAQAPGYEWDETKRESNIRKHGVDFHAISAFEWEEAVGRFDDRHEEARWIAIGFIGPRLHVVAYTVRGDIVRVISLRKAQPREIRGYAKNRR